MNDQESFLAAIRDEPGDDVRRVVYADWLQEQGHDERAAFIRWQCGMDVAWNLTTEELMPKAWANSGHIPADDWQKIGARQIAVNLFRPISPKWDEATTPFPRLLATLRHDAMHRTGYWPSFEIRDRRVTDISPMRLTWSRGFVSHLRIAFHAWAQWADQIMNDPDVQLERVIFTLNPITHGTTSKGGYTTLMQTSDPRTWRAARTINLSGEHMPLLQRLCGPIWGDQIEYIVQEK